MSIRSKDTAFFAKLRRFGFHLATPLSHLYQSPIPIIATRFTETAIEENKTPKEFHESPFESQ